MQRSWVQFPAEGGRGCKRKKGDMDKGLKNHLKMKCRRINDERVGEGQQGPENRESQEVSPVAEDTVWEIERSRSLQGVP